MKQRVLVTVCAGLLALLTGVARADHVSVIVQAGANQKQQFRHVLVTERDRFLAVSGRLVTRHAQGRRRGYVDVAVYDRNGRLLADNRVSLTPALPSRRTLRKGGQRFTAEFAGDIAPGSVVKVAFHPEPAPAGRAPVPVATPAR